MKYYISESSDPRYNLTLEEYFLKKFTDDILLFYVNSDSVIIGRNQIVAKEINNEYAYINNIPIIRRLSGGGAVFHDLGNLNYSFIINKKKGIDYYNYFNKLLIDFLSKILKLSVNSVNSNLFINNKKISGTAQYVYRNRMMHHGTLLISCNLKKMKNVLSINNNFESRASNSIPCNVDNISSIIGKNINLKYFIQEFIKFFSVKNQLTNLSKIKFNYNDNKHQIKFLNNSWNFENSPFYVYNNKKIYNEKEISIKLEVKKNKIINSKVSGLDDFFDNKIIGLNHIYKEFINKFHNKKFVNIFF